MPKLAWVLVFLLALAWPARAQQDFAISALNPNSTDSLYQAPSALSLPRTTAFRDLALANDFSRSTAPVTLASPASPAPPPRPGTILIFVFSASEGHWQSAIGYQGAVVRSPEFGKNLTLHGVNTAVAYFFNEWLAVEGNTIGAWGTRVFNNERSRYFLAAGGPKIALRGKRLEPWVHALIGAAKVNPQTAAGGQWGIGYQLGGGVDYRFKIWLAGRAGCDYVRTTLFSQIQNNFQCGTGIVFNF